MRIIVATEKHTTRYLNASTDEAWAMSSLALLTERFDEGYWYYNPAENEDKDEVLEREALLAMSEESIASLPQAIQRDVRDKIKEARRVLIEDKEAKLEYETIEQIVKTQDLTFTEGRYREPRAWRVLANRSDYEYEDVEIKTIESPTVEIMDKLQV